LLDVGCGQGALSLRLHDLGFEMTACDEFDHCKCREEINFVNSKIEDLPVDSVFDGIVAVEVIEHVENFFGLMPALKDRLKPGGKLIITTPNVDSFTSKMRFLLNGHHVLFSDKNITKDGHINPIHDFQIRYAAEKNGLNVLSHTAIVKESYPKNFLKLMLYKFMRTILSISGRKPIEGRIKVYVLENSID